MRNMRDLKLCIVLLFFAGLTPVYAQEWTDVTDYVLTNPGFDNNSKEGWMWNSDATSQTSNYGCMEFWNGQFDIWQSLAGLPQGRYRVSVQAFYRTTDNNVAYPAYQAGDEEVTAFLYAGGSMQPLVSVYSFSFDEKLSGTWTPDNQHYYPNNMSTASQAFAKGAYMNVMEFELTDFFYLGIMADMHQQSNWCIFDNFKLEYQGTLEMPTQMEVVTGQTQLVAGQTGWCDISVTPANALRPKVSWSSSDPSVVDVQPDGTLTARSKGTAVITATSQSDPTLSASVTITVLSADDLQWIDVTDIYLTNPRFDDNRTEGWEWYSDASSQTCNYGCMEFWNGYFSFYQEIPDLPEGIYRLSAQGFYRTGDNGYAYFDYIRGYEVVTAELFAGDQRTLLPSIYSSSSSQFSPDCWSPDRRTYYPDNMKSASEAFGRGEYPVSVIFHADGLTTLGIENNSYNYSNWCIFDNFKLEFNGEIVKATQVEVRAEHTDLIVGETTQCEAVVTPANATMKKVTWTSDQEQVATVDEWGRVTAVGEGSATIFATTTDGTNLSGSVTVTVTDRPATASSLIVNEVMVSNVDEYVSPANNFDSWVELYNPTDQAVSLAGLWLSDNAANLRQWKVPVDVGILPAKGYKVIWFDNNDNAPTNVPFGLDVDGGTLYVSDGAGQQILAQDYPEGVERVSYARTTDGGENWSMTGSPTPGATNATSDFAMEQLSAPVVDQPSQLIRVPIGMNVHIPEGCTLRYTVDGTLPTLRNGETSSSGYFTINNSVSYRFRLFADGKLPSRVTTRSFVLYDRDYTLPIVSVVSDPRFLYDDSLGVLVRGVNGRPGNGQSSPCNWNMDWDRPVNFSYLTADGEMTLNQDVNLEMCGGWSRAFYPHAFKLKGSKEMGGDKNLPYPFFTDKPYIRNRTLQIRNGGNDNICRFKDPALQYIIQTSGVDLDVQSYEPVHEFINGDYVGVLNIREPNNKHYVYANYGWDDDEIDQFEMSPDSGYVQKCGTADSYLELVDVLSANAANSDTYAEICRMLDIDEYAYYMAMEMYLGNWDWPQNNVKGFRHKDEGRYRFVTFDLDGALSTTDPFNVFMQKEYYTFDDLYPRSLGNITDRIRFVTLFRNMLANDKFRRQFIDAYCLMGGSVFEQNRVDQIITELSDRVNPAMALEGISVDGTANTIRRELRNRVGAMSDALRSYSAFGLSGTQPQRVSLATNVVGATLFVNNLPVPTGQFDGHLFKPMTIKAVSPAGYVFEGWLKETYGRATGNGSNYYSRDAEIRLPDGDMALTACFRALTADERESRGYTPVCINEVSGSNSVFINEYGKKNDWVELYNNTDKPVDVEGMYLTDDLAAPMKYMISKAGTEANTVIPAHGHLIIWCDNLATTSRGLHAPFKISANGGVMMLSAADQSWRDLMRVDAHDGNSTVGRYPDGCKDVYMMNVPTIEKANVTSSYVTRVDQSGLNGIRQTSADADLRLCYAAEQLVVKGTQSSSVQVIVSGADGTLLVRQAARLTGGTAHVDVSHLPHGLYVAQVYDQRGRCVTCKFVR